MGKAEAAPDNVVRNINMSGADLEAPRPNRDTACTKRQYWIDFFTPNFGTKNEQYSINKY
jgi:hypothetical protein